MAITYGIILKKYCKNKIIVITKFVGRGVSMSVTISQLCDLPIIKKNCELVAGKDGMARIIQQVTVIEAPDSINFPFMQPHLVILTTLFTFSDDQEYAFNFVKKLSQRKAAALMVKVERFVNSVPPSLAEAADLYQLPLFAVKKDTPFSEIIAAISSKVINEQFTLIEYLLKQHESYLKSVLNGDEIDIFINALGETLQNYCACLSVSGDFLAQYGSINLKDETETIKSAIDSAIELQDPVLPYNYVGNYALFPCFVRNQIMGYLIIKITAPMNTRDLLYAQQTASYLSIKLSENHIKFETEQRLLITVADEILFRRYADESVIKGKVELLGLTLQQFHFVIVLSFRQEKVFPQLEFRRWADQINKVFPKNAAFIKASELVIIVSMADKSSIRGSTAKRALRSLMRENHGIDLGYSLLTKDAKKLADCYEQAKKAVYFGRIFNADSNLFSYREFIEKGLLLRALDSQEHIVIVKKIIDPIREYDQKHNSQLWLTLEKCLSTNSLEKAAQELHIHISTLRYRLQRIQEIAETDFFSPTGRFILNLAYILSKIHSIQ